MATNYTGNLGFGNPDPNDCFWHLPWYRNQYIKDVVLRNLLTTNRVVSGLEVTYAGIGIVNVSTGTGVINRAAILKQSENLYPNYPAPQESLATNWVYLDGSGVLQISTTYPTGDYLILAVVDVDEGDIVAIYDLRAMWNDPNHYDEVDRILSADDVVDVFLYDTTKDSDGGAWVNSARSQSWYSEQLNTATRGKTAPFPPIALIVATPDTVTIYDLTDFSLPMWMVFETNASGHAAIYANPTHPLKSVWMLNGTLYVATTNDFGALSVVDFLNDETAIRINTRQRYWPHTVGGRNETSTQVDEDFYSYGLVSRACNDVAMVALSGDDLELVRNGGFDTDTDWTKGDGWTISGGVASCDGTQTGNSYLSQAGPVIVGKTYILEFTLSGRTAGSIRPLVSASGFGTWVAIDGTYTETIEAVDNDTLYFHADADFTGSIDNVSLKVVDNREDENGLIVPTIAVATDGGVSVIDGPAGLDTVIDYTWSTYSKTSKVGFDQGFLYIMAGNENETTPDGQAWVHKIEIPTADYSGAAGYAKGASLAMYSTIDNPTTYQNDLCIGPYNENEIPTDWPDVAKITAMAGPNFGTVQGFSRVLEATTPDQGMVARITDSYNTGWQHGDVKLATLADTVAGTIGADITTEHITGGVLTGGDGWTYDPEWTFGSGLANCSDSGGTSWLYQDQGLAGGAYRVQFSMSGRTEGGVVPYVGSDGAGDPFEVDGIHTQTIDHSGSQFFSMYSNGFVGSLDDVFLWAAGAEEVTNGDFDTDTTGWTADNSTLSIESGQLKITNLAGGYGKAYQEITTEPGKVYELILDKNDGDSGLTPIVRDSTTSGTVLLVDSSGGDVAGATYTFTALTTVTVLIFQCQNAATDAYAFVDNVTVRKITDKIENGEFSSDRAWTLAANWSIAAGAAAGDGGTGTMQQAGVFEIGKTYIVQMNIVSITAGTVSLPYDGAGANRFDFAGAGVKRATFTATSTTTCYIYGAGFTGSIDNVRIYEAELVNGTWQPVGQLVVNPSFEGVLVDDWDEYLGTSVGGTVRAEEGAIRTKQGSNSAWMGFSQDFPVVAGEVYQVSYDATTFNTSISIQFSGNMEGRSITGNVITVREVVASPGTTTFTYTFKIATSGQLYVMFMNGGAATRVVDFNNITVKRVQTIFENGEFSDERLWTPGAGWSIGNGVASCDGTQTAVSYLTTDVSGMAAIGKYLVKFDVANLTAGRVKVFLDSVDTPYENANGSYEYVVDKTTTGTTLYVTADPDFIGDIDNVEIYALDVPDRSYNNNPLQVVGQITAAPVAIDSDVVAWSGFTAADYIIQPTVDLYDFGTGDFYVCGWINTTVTGSIQIPFARSGPGAAGQLSIYVGTDGLVVLNCGPDGAIVGVPSTNAIKNNQWSFFCVKRESGTGKMFLDGVFGADTSAPGDITFTGQDTYLGNFTTLEYPFLGSIALIRVGAGAPTDEQIQEIYNTEKVLFQNGAKAVLTAGPNVVDLSFDPTSNTYLVANTDGASSFSADLFQGLKRVGRKAMVVAPTCVDHNHDTGAMGAADRVLVTNPTNTAE